MGLFLSMTGVIGSSVPAVTEAISAFITTGLVSAQPEQEESGYVLGSDAGVTVLYPSSFFDWDECTCFISEKLKVPAFSFHIHDDDLWMYRLFVEGREIDRFNPIPSYWEELTPEEEASWGGNADIIAGVMPGLLPDSITNYLVPWDLDSTDDKRAYPDDKYAIQNCWQLLDFMKKLRLAYPIDDQGQFLGKAFSMLQE